MLILKSPIKLHLSALSAAHTEGFAQRILGNYSLMNGHWGAKDLLFLLTSDQEPEQSPSTMTTLVQNTVYQDNQSVTIEVVNQVINRLLLDATPRLTYQDQVYITSVLNRLGMTDVEQFIQQVRQLRIENESTVAMLALYQEQQSRLVAQKGAQPSGYRRTLVQDAEGEVLSAEQPKVQMSLQVFNRLHTAQLSQTIQLFQQSAATVQNQFARTELRLSEHVRLGNSLTLAQLKREVHQTSFVHLSHHLNQFEAGLLLPPPKTEEQVLQQAAVSALVGAVDAAFIQVLSRPSLERELWFHTERAIQKSAENALLRFERYHTQSFLMERTSAPSAQKALYEYALEMAEYQQTEQNLFPHSTHTQVQESRHFESQPLLHRTTLETESLLPEQPVNEASATQPPLKRTEPQTHDTVQQLVRETVRLSDAASNALPPSPTAPPQMKHPAPSEQDESGPQPPAQGQAQLEAQPPQTQTPKENAKNFTPFLRHLSPQTVKQMEQHLFREVQRTQLSSGASASFSEEGEPLPSPENEEVEALQEQAKLLLHQMSEVTNAQHISISQSESPVVLHTSEQPPLEMVHVLPDGQPQPEQPSERPLTLPDGSDAPSARLSAEQQTLVVQQLERLKQETAERAEKGAASYPEEQAERVFLTPQTPDQKEQGQIQALSQAALVPEVHVPAAEPQALVVHELERFHQEIAQMPAHKAAERMTMEPPPAPVLHTEQAQPEEPDRQLREQLRLFEQRNREMHELIHQVSPRAPAVVQPDRARTLRQSLRALQAPETVLKEIYAEGERAQQAAPSFTPQELRLLEMSDPQTKAIYERILAYQKNPQAALAQGFVRPASMGELQMELRGAVPPQAEEEASAHVSLATPQDAEMYQGSLRQVRRSTPASAQTVYESRAAANRIRFVHKQQVQEMAEELLEQANIQKTNMQTVTQTDTRTLHTRTDTTRLNETQMQTVQNMTKDMSELVNQTLQRQMRTISDQVYRQIEKRLQLERSRRGRF